MKNINHIISIFIFSSLSLLIPSLVFSQNNTKGFNVENNVTKMIKKYYGYKTLAEKAILKNDFCTASKYYSKAFKAKHPFLLDLNMAIRCELNCKANIKKLYAYLKLKKMVSKLNGQKIIDIFKREFGDIRDLSFIDTLIPQLDTVKRKYFSNNSVSHQFELLDSKDQEIRQYCYGLGIEDIYNDIKCKDTIKYIDSINLHRILELFKNNELNYINVNFLGERISTVIDHASQWGYFDWYPILKDEVIKGNLKNEIFAYLVDKTLSFRNPYITDTLLDTYYGTYSGARLYDIYMSPIFDKDELTKINRNRAEIYLDDFESFEKKVIFIQNHDYFNYLGFPIIISYLSIPFDSSQEEIKLLKHRQDEFIEEIKGVGRYKLISVSPNNDDFNK